MFRLYPLSVNCVLYWRGARGSGHQKWDDFPLFPIFPLSCFLSAPIWTHLQIIRKFAAIVWRNISFISILYSLTLNCLGRKHQKRRFEAKSTKLNISNLIEIFNRASNSSGKKLLVYLLAGKYIFFFFKVPVQNCQNRQKLQVVVGTRPFPLGAVLL